MKKHHTLKSVLAGIIFLFALNLQAQDQPHFSMYMYQPSIINPAAMGSFDEINGALFFNKQLVGFENSPMVGFLDFGMPIGRTNAYIGLQTRVDRIGVTTNTGVGASFAYRIKLNMKHYLSLGLNLSANNINSALFTAPTNESNDWVFNSNPSAWYPDIKLGAYYFADNVFAGFSVGNLFTNSLFYDSLSAGSEFNVNGNDMHFYITGGWQKKLGDHWKIRPCGLIKYVPGSPLQLDINASAVFKDMFGFGLSYRTTSTLVFNLTYSLNNYFVAGYSFNWGLAYRERANFTGHELMLAFRLKNPKRVVPVEIPRF